MGYLACGMALIASAWVLITMPVMADPLRFATVDFEPYALVDDKDGGRGLIVDINAAIAARSGLSFSDEVLPIARMTKNLLRGASDCSVFLLSPWSGEKFLPVAEIFSAFDSVVVTREGLPITQVKDLRGHLLALPRGSYTAFAIATDPEIRRHYTSGYEQSAKLLKAGRVDALAGTALSIYHYLSKLKIQRKDLGGILPFDSKPIWLQCIRKPALQQTIARLKQAADALRAEGVFRRMLDIYVPQGFK